MSVIPVEQENQGILTISSTDGTLGHSLSHRVPGTTTGLKESEEQMKASVVALILDSKPEEAIGVLCRWYRVQEPRLGVGVFEGRTKGVAAVYSVRRREILAARREYLYDPFVIVHEFYHHLRSSGGRHRGTEKQADKFALDFIAAYRRVAEGLVGESGGRSPESKGSQTDG